MNRQTKQLLALAGVLAVGLGAYAALRVWNAGEEEREAAQADYVLQLSDVTALSFDSGDGPLSFTLEETGWTWDGDSEFPVNGTELDALREDLAALKAERIIPEPDALADYGLEEPAYTLTARTDSGESTTLLLGSLDPGGSHRYAMLDGGTEVYTVDGSLTSSLDSELLDLMELPQLPDLDEKNHHLRPAGADRRHCPPADFRCGDPGRRRWRPKPARPTRTGSPSMRPPRRRRRSPYGRWTGSRCPRGPSGWRTGCTTCPPYTWTGCSAFKADQEELSACGMDGASLLTVSLTSGETFTLAIGGQTEDGSYVYAALEAPAPGCDLFLISADKARTLSDLNYESLSADEEAE